MLSIFKSCTHSGPAPRSFSGRALPSFHNELLLKDLMRSNLSGPDHCQMVCDSKFFGSQIRYLGNKNRLGIVTCLQQHAREVLRYFHAEGLGGYRKEIALLNIRARHIAPRHANVEGSIVRPMANG